MVKAEWRFAGRSIPVKMRLKGDWVDHLRGDKWSYRVHVEGEDAFLGMRHFSIQNPATRNYLYEWAYLEHLRAEKEWPRYVYIRPSEQVLRRSGVEGRDKDTKPVVIDLGSYLFLEIFHRWLTKAGELEVSEMLPGPDDLLWQEPDGRRTFELRTQIVPRA